MTKAKTITFVFSESDLPVTLKLFMKKAGVADYEATRSYTTPSGNTGISFGVKHLDRSHMVMDVPMASQIKPNTPLRINEHYSVHYSKTKGEFTVTYHNVPDSVKNKNRQFLQALQTDS